MGHLFQNLVYLQIRRGWIGIRILTWAGGHSEWEGVPEIWGGMDAKGRVQVVAADEAPMVDNPHFRRFTAFNHPRLLIDQVDLTEKTLQIFLKKAGAKGFAFPTKWVVHLADEMEGGIADIEIRALSEVIRKLGGQLTAMVTAARHLTSPEILELGRRKDANTPLYWPIDIT